MRGSMILKLLAFVLAVCTLTVALGCGLAVFLMGSAGLYNMTFTQWEDHLSESKAHSLAAAMTESYAARSLSGFTGEELAVLNWGNTPEVIGYMQDISEDWRYTIMRGNVLEESNYRKGFPGREYTFTLTVNYPKSVPADAGLRNTMTYHDRQGTQRMLNYWYEESPEYTVKVWLPEGWSPKYNNISADVYAVGYPVRYTLIGIGAGCVAGALLCLLYLALSAGVQKDGTVALRGANRLPLDLYAGAVGLICWVAAALTMELVAEALCWSTGIGWSWICLSGVVVVGILVCVLSFLWALFAQWRAGWSILWRRSIIGLLLRLCRRAATWGWKMLCKLGEVLPVVWQYWLIALFMAGVPMFLCLMAIATHGIFRFFFGMLLMGSIGLDMALVLYGGFAFGTVLKGARKMAAGQLHGQVDTRFLVGAYRRCGMDMNSVAEAAVLAAGEQMRSERMKTELITNVSHDIKTPLTSIINYVDLLQKTDDPQTRAEYLQVLERQSQRMKKLVEDLVEMSRATTGDMPVELQEMDLVEAVTQALGEFSGKMEAQSLQVVFDPPAAPVHVTADGRLTWRVLSNLLSNTVKYAMTGTRVYVDIAAEGQQVALSIKNISGSQLNIPAEELMERFVRGDSARNTEGSGLGLNIARSLMQLQGGALTLLVDGDLFKVTLSFPIA